MDRIAKLVENVLKIGGVLAVFGFISIRAHLSVIGVGWDADLGTEKYLTEAYQLVVASFLILLGYLPTLLKIIVPVLLLLFFTRNTMFFRGLVGKLPPFPWPRAVRILLPLALTGVSVAIYRAIQSETLLQIDQPYIGILNGVERYYAEEVFSGVVAFCCLGQFLYFRLYKKELDTVIRIAWHCFFVTVLVVCFYLPIYYGINVRDFTYPKANISVKKTSQPLCGLLVLQTDNSLLLWSSMGNRGQIIAVPLREVVAVTLGPKQDLKKTVFDAMDVSGLGKPDKPSVTCTDIGNASQILDYH